MLTTQSTPPALGKGAGVSLATKRKAGGQTGRARVAGAPGTKLSSAITLWPSAKRRSHMCDPTNPAAPETTMRKYPPKSPILADTTDASWIERSALIALMAASLALFWLRFRKVLDAIRGSRATPDFEIGRAH